MIRKLFCLPAVILLTMGLCVSAKPLSESEIAAKLKELEGKVHSETVKGSWQQDRYIYSVNGPEGKTSNWVLDAATGEKRPLDLSQQEVAARGNAKLNVVEPSQNGGASIEVTLANETDKTVNLHWVESNGRWKEYGTLAAGEKRTQHSYEGHVWLFAKPDRTALAAFRVASGGSYAVMPQDVLATPKRLLPRRPRNSPAPKDFVASLKDHNLFLKTPTDQTAKALTTDGTEQHGYEGEPIWSPDGKYLAIRKVKRVTPRKIIILESTPEGQPQPRVKELTYPKPGDEIDTPSIQLVEVATGKIVTPPGEAFPTPWSLKPLHWLSTGEFLCEYNRRGHQTVKLAAISPKDGSVRTVVEEKSDTFVDYTNKINYYFLSATNELVWMSQRDGWNHLYLIDLTTGAVKCAITSGNWVVREVLEVDEASRTILCTAMGINPREDPYHKHLVRVSLDGKPLVRLTESDGTHTWEFSPDKKWLVAKWSRVDQPFVTEVRDAATGRLVAELSRGDASALTKTGWTPPQRFVAKGRDGKADIHGIIIRPMHFEPGKKYPVIEKIYAGPQDFFTPKSWSRQTKSAELALYGFILVQLDGSGTNWRHKAFHDVCFRNLHDAGFPDRILWLRAAAAAHPELDLDRVGIYGGSAGGQNAMRAVIDHGHVYKAAAADCGCHDNRMDKIWWNEQWMGWPLGEWYDDASNLKHAHRLNGKLLLTWGELDTNVDPASSMQVAHALTRANKDFDMFLTPGGGHGSGEGGLAYRKRIEFFVRHLQP